MKKGLIKGLKNCTANDKFWKILDFLGTVKDPTTLSCVVEKFRCQEAEVYEVVNFLAIFRCGFDIKPIDGDVLLTPLCGEGGVRMEMSLPEWFAFQAQFPMLFSPRGKSAAYDILLKKFLSIKMEYPHFDLYDYFQCKKNKKHIGRTFFVEGLLELIEGAATNGVPVRIFLRDDRHIDVYPKKIVFLEGGHSFVCEEIFNKSLVSFDLKEVRKIDPLSLDEQYEPNFSQFEVDDFIEAVRSVSGNEERVVLKIMDSAQVDLSPEYHYFGNPYLTTNIEGDLIWAASVEASDPFFEWIASMGDNVRILDNPKIEKLYHEYLERNKRIG